jgi:two-component system NarL family response regulator
MTIGVLLVDDHRLVREALRDSLLSVAGIRVLGEAGDAESALKLAAELEPDVIVLDIRLSDVSGIEAAARLRDLHCPAKIVALSAYTDKRFVREMLRAGATAYVTKSAASGELVNAIRSVAAGQAYFCPLISASIAEEIRGGDEGGDAARLGRREREVLRLVAQGRRSAEIAEDLHISVATVEVHRRNIMRKLGLRTVAELTRYAIREGLVAPPVGRCTVAGRRRRGHDEIGAGARSRDVCRWIQQMVGWPRSSNPAMTHSSAKTCRAQSCVGAPAPRRFSATPPLRSSGARSRC